MPREHDEDVSGPLILGRYRPLEELGEGGYGSVVLAWDTRMQRRVAIKRLPLSVHDRRYAKTAGLAEARTAALLNHPDIVTVYEWDTDADEAFLIMEHVDGASLAELLDANGPLDLDEGAAVLDAVFSAVEFAHENGVFHLDLKPHNVLIARDGRVKVTDFGVSTLSTVTGHASTLGGTLGYMPPEQLRGEHIGPQTDVWALGALAFEVLTDANPFVSESVEGALFKAEVAETPLPSDFAADLPREIDDVVLGALAPEANDRYPSVTRFATALLPYLGDERLGRGSLAARVELFVEDDVGDAAPPSWERVGLWDRLEPYGRVLGRVIAAAAAGWLAWAGLSAFALKPTALYVGTGLAALAGLLAPELGAAVGLIAFAAGLAAVDAYVLGGLFVVLATAYWWLVGRRNAAAAIVPLAAPLLGIGQLALATPFLAGFLLSPVAAAAASLAGGTLALMAWAISGGVRQYLSVDWRLFAAPLEQSASGAALRALWTSPATWALLASWALAAAAMSLLCRRASRPAAFAGAALGAAIVWAGSAVGAWALGQPDPWTASLYTAQQLTGSLILVVLVVAAGPPVRPEEE